jgi:CheY-like chemotaxis protein
VNDASGGGPRTILLVEDDDQVRAFIRTLLLQEGHQVLEARTGIEGFNRARELNCRIDLLLSDMLLPELSGYDLAVRLRAENPRMKILFITGYVEGDIVQKCVADLNASFLDKPFQPAVLRDRVRQILASNAVA